MCVGWYLVMYKFAYLSILASYIHICGNISMDKFEYLWVNVCLSVCVCLYETMYGYNNMIIYN